MLTKKDLQDMFGLKLSTINKYMRDGMPFSKIGTGKKLVRFNENDVKQWLMNTKGGSDNDI